MFQPTKPTPKKKKPANYEATKKKQAEISRSKSKLGREIGPPPPVVSQTRRDDCLGSLRLYCEQYHPAKFFLGWSADHLEAIGIIERCIRTGGQFALAMPRGSGKTELSKRAVEWAILGGHRRFIMLIGATEPDATRMMRDLKSTFEKNKGIGEDFPEVCHPIRALEGIINRANGQTMDGKRPGLIWRENEIRLPAWEGSKSSAAVVWTRGITGAVRGANTTAANGGSMRPDLCIIDDSQTRDSAKSIEQTYDREMTIDGDVIELAGPDTRIAALMCCTVIYPGDLSERFLDRSRHPDWDSKKFKAVYAFPTQMKLWEENNAIRRENPDSPAANEHYAAHAAEMDAGAQVAWPARKKPGDLSALQTAMTFYFDKPATFKAEWQNEPEERSTALDLSQLVPADIQKRLTQLPRQRVPRDCTRITADVDVQANILYYTVCAWDERFGGSIIDYGAWPRQNRDYFAAADARPGLSDVYPGMEEAARIYAGLRDLCQDILGRGYPSERGGEMRVEKCLIDSGYSTDAVYQFCRQSSWQPLLLPSKGFGLGASKLAMPEWPKREGERRGFGCIISASEVGKGRAVKIDTYTWKSFVAERLRSADGTPGAIRIFGDRPFDHQLLADHLTSEFRIPTEGRGRKLEEWKIRPDRRENHWWDCLVGCAVAASILGLKWDAGSATGDHRLQQQTKPRRRLSDIQAEKMREEAR